MAKYDKSLEYISDTQTLIGQQKLELMNTATGELIHVDQISKRVYGTKNFWKCYLMDFLTVLGIIDSKQLDIFIYIVENTNQGNNMFIGTYKKIAEDVGASSRTISIILKKLQDNNFIKKVQNGVWLVNPNILMKGNDTKRQILLSYYNSEQPINEITMNRTKQKALPTQEQQVKGQLEIADSEGNIKEC
jgi:predicted transcriptional regulator